MGESFGIWKMGADETIMPYLDMANIACGMHASDPTVMGKTVALAKQYGVEIGAHPGYPDLIGFGRRSLATTEAELKALFIYQIGALQALCQSQNVALTYVKPHGALYNDMMKNQNIFCFLLEALASYNSSLPLVIQANSQQETYQQIAHKKGITLYFEAFADRAYLSNGALVPRSQKGASHNHMEPIKKQITELLEKGTITSVDGKVIDIKADTLCIHGDGPLALDIAEFIGNR